MFQHRKTKTRRELLALVGVALLAMPLASASAAIKRADSVLKGFSCGNTCGSSAVSASAKAVCQSPLYYVSNGAPTYCTKAEGFCYVGYCDLDGVHKSSVGSILVCPPGSTRNFYDGNHCWVPVDPRKDPPCNGIGNPIDCGSGTKRQTETDVDAGSLRLTRTFAAYRWWRNDGPFGQGWYSSLHSRRVNFTPGNSNAPQDSADVDRGDSKRFTFLRTGADWATPEGDVADRLSEIKDAQGARIGWSYYEASSENIEQYDANGTLLAITTRAGRTTTFGYNVAGQLDTVTDHFGRALGFTYDAAGRVSRMTDVTGGLYDYTYDANGNLSTVTYPGNGQGVRPSRTYLYENVDYPNVLTGILDENGWRYATFTYNVDGLATETKYTAAPGVDVNRYAIAYTAPYAQTSVTDPLGTTRTYSQSIVQWVPRTTGLSQPCNSCGPNNASALVYDGNGNITARTDFNNKKACYAYDTSRNLETARVEGLLSTESCTTALSSPPNRADVRRITTTWHPAYRLPATITEPAAGGTRTTTFGYDASGNLTQKSIVAPKNDGSGQTTTRTWSWTYATLGRMLSATDPNGKITTYTYHPDADPDLGRRGNLATVANPLGHVAQIPAYTADGRPAAIVDPNGATTTLSYDTRGRLTSRNVGGETTGYDYDDVGQLTKVTLPDGSYLAYAYDGAHRLTRMTDGLGNEIVYTLDPMGNRIQEQAFDPAGTLARTHSRQYDALNRLAAELGAQGQTTSYTYDNSANLTNVTDPLTHATGEGYDAINRLTRVLDPNQGVTQYAYDPAGNLTQVTDPRNLATSYTYDGLGNLIKQVNPDAGTTTNTYDPAGSLLTRVDARGVTAAYTYDDLNRTRQIVYNKAGSPSETHRFTYDVGANAKGRLTDVSDPAAQTTWTYTPQGRVASKTQTVGGSLTLVYGYNAAGQLSSLATPSGQQIGYAYLNNRIAAITVNGQTLLSDAGTEPFGPLAGWRWGNGLNTFRDYDADGRLASWEFRNGTSLIRKELGFDAAGRVTSITDPLNPAASQTYGYDALDRLSLAESGVPVAHTQRFGYDAVGNRVNLTVDGALTDLTYGATSNRLEQLSGALPPDSLLASGNWTLTYNLANRLVSASGPAKATYKISALGQRVAKTVNGATTTFVYDEQGHLIGEYDGSGNLIQETVWLEDLPVATLRPTGPGNPTPIAIYYVHADHLGSPRAVTRPSDNALMWQWDLLDPFGANAANEDPGGQGTFKYNLRFPGQYYDAETGTHYNYFRDYDPTIGRYVESDVIGLAGGINTYTYVVSDPISAADPPGLKRRDMGFPRGPGCGPGYGQGIPDNPLLFPFRKCCVDHDYCYDDCEKQPTKAQCDDSFCECLRNTCSYSGACRFLADLYCNSARAFGKLSRKCLTCVPPYSPRPFFM